MHFPKKEDSSRESKPNRRLMAMVITMVLSVVGHPALAQDRFNYQPVSIDNAELFNKINKPLFDPIELKELEEVVVSGLDLSIRPDDRIFNLYVGIQGRVMVHVYDSVTDSWNYVGLSSKPQL